MCKERDNTLCWYFHIEYIYDLDPPDAGAVNHIRFWFGVYIYKWLWEYGNVELLYLSLFYAYYYIILITILMIKARRQVLSHPESLERYFTKVGCGMSATG